MNTPNTQAPAKQWKVGNEFAPYHPQASHVDPNYRDGWNACYRAALASQPAQDEPTVSLTGPERVWSCTVIGLAEDLPRGSDAPMRRAVYDAFAKVTGDAPAHIFSGWNAPVPEHYRAVIEDRLPDPEVIRKECLETLDMLPPQAQPAPVAKVGCENANGTLNIHPETETCEVCAPVAVDERFANLRLDLDTDISDCGIHTAGIDLPFKDSYWLSQIQCHGATKDEAVTLAEAVATALQFSRSGQDGGDAGPAGEIQAGWNDGIGFDVKWFPHTGKRLAWGDKLYRAPQPAAVPASQAVWEAKPAGCIKPDTATHVYFYEQDFYVLSNFSAFRVTFDGQTFDTSEAAYHYQRFTAAEDRRGVQYANSAHEAFRYAQDNKARQRPDWDAAKAGIMREILRAKAQQHEYVRRKLLATGDRQLVEDSWRDDFWGWGPNRDGQNMLGKLWMEVRSELRATNKGASNAA